MPSNPTTRPFHRSILAWLLAAAASLLLAACGGGGGGGEEPAVTPPPPPPAANRAPVASFTAAATAVAGDAVALDASSSTDADGDTLVYSWNFGDGIQGGGNRIAHVFATAGSYAVQLTVDDGKGGVNQIARTVTVTAPPAALAQVQTLAIVRGTDGALLQGVTVAVAGGTSTATATTNTQGRATLVTGTGVPTLLKFSKTGYADQFRNASLPASADSGYLEVTMLQREAALTLADAAAGGTLTGKDGAKVTFPPGALVNAAGQPVSGPVQVNMTPVDVGANPAAFPGRFAGLRSTGQQGLLLSYGTVEYVLTAAGSPVQLAPGKKATIEIPVYATLHRDGTPMKAGDTSPLWSLDERTGAWTEEGSGTVVVANTPSGFALRAEVQHFTWWNHDDFDGLPGKPKPKCLVDTNADGVLEDLTDTGHCWHAGTGPEQPPKVAASTGDRKHTLRAQRLADAASTRRIPAFTAWASTPTTGGQVLEIPANLDVTFRSSAKNGTLFGMAVVNLGAGVEQDLPILLRPVAINAGTQAISLPYDANFRADTVGQVDRFTFTATAGATYQVTVAPLPGTTLAGTVQVLTVGGAQVNGGPFSAASGFAGTANATAAGTMTVVVTSTGNTPGAYSIKVTRLATGSTCASPQTLAVPQTLPDFQFPSGLICFNLQLATDDALEILSNQNINAQGTLKLISPSGQVSASDTYGTATFDGMLLRVAIAEAGTWRLEINNSANTIGRIQGLRTAALPVAGTMGNTDTTSYTGPAGAVNARYHVVKATTPNGELAVTLDGKLKNHTVRAWPATQTFGDSGINARVMHTPPGLYPLLGVQRGVGNTSWDYTLSTSLPRDLALDTPLATSLAPGGLYVYRLPGQQGQQLTLAGLASGSANPNFSIFLPETGTQIGVPVAGVLYTLPADGVYTLLVRANTSAASTLSWRVNSVAAAEAVPAGTFERSGTLEMGQLRRYAVPLEARQLLALTLSTPTTYDVSTLMQGITVDGAGLFFSSGSGPGPRSTRTGARFAQGTGTGELWVWNSGDPGAGSYTVGLQSPTPTPATLGALLDLAPSLGQLKTWRFDLAQGGLYLLCTRHNGDAGLAGALDPRVWGPSAVFAGYTGGDISGATAGAEVETIGSLRAGINGLSVMPGSATVTSAQARLVALASATAIATGAAATTGSIAACQRTYHTFNAVVGTAYTVRVTAGFTGSLRVRKVVPNGDVTARIDPPANTGNVGATPVALTAGVERTVSFTIAAGQGGNHVIEVDGDGDAAGSYTVQLSTP
jgi:PKD repeat protein